MVVHTIGKLCDKTLEKLTHGIRAFESVGNQLMRPYFLGLLADAYRESGEPAAGLVAVEQAFDIMNKTGMRLHESELFRLKGCLLLSQSKSEQAATCFAEALSAARRQNAKSLELRAATSLGRLWQANGRQKDVYELVSPIYAWFNEGHGSGDLPDAAGLLDAE